MAYGKGGTINHEAIECTNASVAYSLVIPKICYGIWIKPRGTATVRVYLKRDPNVDETPVYVDELNDDGDYFTVTDSLVIDNIRLIDKHVLWVSAAAGTYIEVIYVTGF